MGEEWDKVAAGINPAARRRWRRPASCLGDLSEEIAETGGNWSIAEVLNHLLDTEKRYLGRVQRMRREDRPAMRIMPDPDYTRLPALKA